jgi:hypothetical protein
MLVARVFADVALDEAAARALGVARIQDLGFGVGGKERFVGENAGAVGRCGALQSAQTLPGRLGGRPDAGWGAPAVAGAGTSAMPPDLDVAPPVRGARGRFTRAGPARRLPGSGVGAWPPTWMTTSEESSTLYSSPQMRLDWPFSNSASRAWRADEVGRGGSVGGWERGAGAGTRA